MLESQNNIIRLNPSGLPPRLLRNRRVRILRRPPAFARSAPSPSEQGLLHFFQRAYAVAGVAVRRVNQRLIAEPFGLGFAHGVPGNRAHLPVQVDFSPKYGSLRQRYVIK